MLHSSNSTLCSCKRQSAAGPAPSAGKPAGIKRRGLLGNTYQKCVPPPVDPAMVRLDRYRLQAHSRDILPEYRVAHCLRSVLPGQNVQVWKSQEKAHYKNLQVCGSVWVCPVCAAKISEHRRVELVEGIERWKELGGSVYMVTWTVPHYSHQRLKAVLSGFMDARRVMKNRKPWRTLTRIAVAGTVRALEVTYGENGWHVHSHEILFIKPGVQVLDLIRVEKALYDMWLNACQTVGLGSPSLAHGVQVQDGQQAGKYASKWGMDCELTKAHLKRAIGSNYSPWDMLRKYGEGLKDFGDLFREYARAFRGKRQLVWSGGLRKLLGLNVEASDEEIALRVEADAIFLGALERCHWSLVKQAEKRGELLSIAESKGWEGVKAFIRELVRCSGKG